MVGDDWALTNLKRFVVATCKGPQGHNDAKLSFLGLMQGPPQGLPGALGSSESLIIWTAIGGHEGFRGP